MNELNNTNKLSLTRAIAIQQSQIKEYEKFYLPHVIKRMIKAAEESNSKLFSEYAERGDAISAQLVMRGVDLERAGCREQ